MSLSIFWLYYTPLKPHCLYITDSILIYLIDFSGLLVLYVYSISLFIRYWRDRGSLVKASIINPICTYINVSFESCSTPSFMIVSEKSIISVYILLNKCADLSSPIKYRYVSVWLSLSLCYYDISSIYYFVIWYNWNFVRWNNFLNNLLI